MSPIRKKEIKEMASIHTIPSTLPLPPSRQPNPNPNLSPSTWVETLRSHARSNSFHSALSTYLSMTAAGIPSDHFAFPAVLKSAAGLRDLSAGHQIHAAVVKSGYHSTPPTIPNTLITMYAKCPVAEGALKVFDKMPHRDQVSWNSIISALCMFDEWELALDWFRRMLEEEEQPSSFTLVSIALACSNIGVPNGLHPGKQVHGYGLRGGLYLDSNAFTYNALIAMYGKLGSVEVSVILFDRFDERNTVSWNTIISALTQNEWYVEAISFLREMVCSGVKPDGVTLSSALPACSHLELLGVGREIHAFAVRNDGLAENSFVASALLDMYCNFEEVEKGRLVFDRAADCRLGLWNAMICGYAKNGMDEEALELFIELEEGGAGLRPNATTVAGVLPCCVRSEAFSCKEAIHGYVAKRGLAYDKYVQNALMDMYSRVGKIDVSCQIFNSMEDRDTVSWNTMITRYLVCGLYSEAFKLLTEMQLQGGTTAYNRPNNITLMSVLPACAALSALAKGKEIHGYAMRNRLDSYVAVGSALVDMYAKCGCLSISRSVFDRMLKRNVITWNVLIMAYGMHGHGGEAMRLFEELVSAGEVKPNEVTLIAAIAACSHSGMAPEIFSGLKFYLMGEFTVPIKGFIHELVSAAGGTIWSRDDFLREGDSNARKSTATSYVVYNEDPPEEHIPVDFAVLLRRRSERAKAFATKTGARAICHTWLWDAIATSSLEFS